MSSISIFFFLNLRTNLRHLIQPVKVLLSHFDVSCIARWYYICFPTWKILIFCLERHPDCILKITQESCDSDCNNKFSFCSWREISCMLPNKIFFYSDWIFFSESEKKRRRDTSASGGGMFSLWSDKFHWHLMFFFSFYKY